MLSIFNFPYVPFSPNRNRRKGTKKREISDEIFFKNLTLDGIRVDIKEIVVEKLYNFVSTHTYPGKYQPLIFKHNYSLEVEK